MATTPYKTIFCTQVNFNTTTTGGTAVNVHGCQQLIMRTTQDCYVDFDQPVASQQSYKISGSNTADTTVVVPDGSVNNLYVQGVTQTGTLYIIVITN